VAVRLLRAAQSDRNALSSRDKRIAADTRDGRRSRFTHDDLQFAPEQLNHRFNAFLAE
jgi:hypothetical protein